MLSTVTGVSVSPHAGGGESRANVAVTVQFAVIGPVVYVPVFSEPPQPVTLTT